MTEVLDRLNAILALGGPIVGILIALSVVSLAVCLWKIAAFLAGGIGRNHPTRHRTELVASLAELPRDGAEARAELALGRLESGFRLLDAVAQTAPLLGLLGTVLGMIEAFRELQAAGATVDPAALAGGIWVALTTTAAGLAVAIPAALVLAWLDARLSRERLLVAEAMTQGHDGG